MKKNVDCAHILPGFASYLGLRCIEVRLHIMKHSETSILSLVFENIPAVAFRHKDIFSNVYIVSLVNLLFRFPQIMIIIIIIIIIIINFVEILVVPRRKICSTTTKW